MADGPTSASDARPAKAQPGCADPAVGGLEPHVCAAGKKVMRHLGGTLHGEHAVADGYDDCDHRTRSRGKGALAG